MLGEPPAAKLAKAQKQPRVLQGKYSEAQELLEEAREIFERKLGLEHPKVARTLKNLADVFEAQVCNDILRRGKALSLSDT